MNAKRRAFLRRLGSLGAASFLTTPLSLLADEQTEARNLLLVLTFGNGWGHQGMDRRGQTLDTMIRSETDWDLPTNLEALRPQKDRLSIVRNLRNPFGGGLHGSGWSTLTVQPTDGRLPGGISIDRAIAGKVGMNDAFDSIALGIAAQAGRPPVCASADGIHQPFPAIASPTEAFNLLFGSEGVASLDAESLLNGAIASSIRDVRAKLAGPEAVKLDQYVSSIEAVANQQRARRASISIGGLPARPTLVYKPGLDKEVMRSHFDVARLAFAFGLTRVVHISLLGFNDHNAGWNSLGYAGDAHEYVAHVDAGPAFSTACYNAVVQFQAQEIARLVAGLSNVIEKGVPLSTKLTVLWLNSGGGKHHSGSDSHPAVILNPVAAKLRNNVYVEMAGRPISELFLSVAQSVGANMMQFGHPDHCRGPLAALQRP
jgi:hypothetical protein